MSKHPSQPLEVLDFIEMEGFADDWRRLGLNDDELIALEMTIMVQPMRPPVIPGTGGLRKIRYAPRRWQRGKSGAVRVCYVYFHDFSLALLVVAYAKNEQDDLSAADNKAIRQLIAREEKALAERAIK